MKRFLMGVAMLMSLAGIVRASNSEFDRATLKGLPPVRVLIEGLDNDAPSGLTKQLLQTDVELKLRSTGVPVFTAEYGTPYLYVRVTMLPVGDASNVVAYAYSVEVELDQSIILVRDHAITVTAPTWSASSIHVIFTDFVAKMRSSVSDDVDKFLNAYLSVNPKH